MGMKNLSMPCFDSGLDKISSCLEGGKRKDGCTYLQTGGKWETCNSGGKSSYLRMYCYFQEAHQVADVYTIKLYHDGDNWYAVFSEFSSLEESPIGFGDTRKKAIGKLMGKIEPHEW